MAAVSNKALITEDGKYGMLETFVTNVKRAGVTNFVLIALDDHTHNAMKAIGVESWRAHTETLLKVRTRTAGRAVTPLPRLPLCTCLAADDTVPLTPRTLRCAPARDLPRAGSRGL